jgi:hypothetical protein
MQGTAGKVETILRDEGLENLKLPNAPTGEIGADGMRRRWVLHHFCGSAIGYPAPFGLKLERSAGGLRRIFGGTSRWRR